MERERSQYDAYWLLAQEEAAKLRIGSRVLGPKHSASLGGLWPRLWGTWCLWGLTGGWSSLLGLLHPNWHLGGGKEKKTQRCMFMEDFWSSDITLPCSQFRESCNKAACRD